MRLNQDNKPLTNSQLLSFRSALRDAFFNRSSFSEFLLLQLNRNREDLTREEEFPTEILNVIRKADEGDWSAELLDGACMWRPQNVTLHTFAQQFGLTTILPSDDFFESKISLLQKDIDPSVLRTRLSKIEAQVCIIEIPLGLKVKQGTGFLLGPGAVLTNFHVMREVIKGSVDPRKVSFRFDYKMLEDGRTVSQGTPYYLPEQKQEWLIDYSEYSPLDQQANVGMAVPQVDELDYALIRVQDKRGKKPIGVQDNKDPNASPRGCISVPSVIPKIISGMELWILHHPDKKRLSLALNTNSVLSVNTNYTRIRYQTNTAKGSSGAPCFNTSLDLIALHHIGDPSDNPQYNQGVPISTILDLLKKRDKFKFLGESQSPTLEVYTQATSEPQDEAAEISQKATKKKRMIN